MNQTPYFSGYLLKRNAALQTALRLVLASYTRTTIRVARCACAGMSQQTTLSCRDFFTIANKYNGFVQIHTQLDAKFNEDILRLTADFPNTRVILSHCLAGAKPADLRQLFEARSNIYCELSAQGAIHNRLSGLNRPPRVFSEERVRSDWLELIQQYSKRVMVGSDACCGWFSSYSEMIDEIRTNLFPHLEPELMERLAYKNAVTLFNLQ